MWHTATDYTVYKFKIFTIDNTRKFFYHLNIMVIGYDWAISATQLMNPRTLGALLSPIGKILRKNIHYHYELKY